MSTISLDDDQHVRHIIDVLSAEFDQQLPAERIELEAEQVYLDLRENSRVESFIPILALRRARASLSVEASQSPRQEDEQLGLVEPAEHEIRQVGEVVHLVDGPFEITRIEPGDDHVGYHGRWLDTDD